jgi:hypothetical protein
MAQIATKSKPVVTSVHEAGVPAARFTDVVERSVRLSDELLKSLETSERAAIEAVGQFVIRIEEAVPREVTATSEVMEQLTESGLEMLDRLLHTEFTLIRGAVDSAAKAVSRHNGVKIAA